MGADGATLKLDNRKNGWKGVCVHQEANGEEYLCAVRALGRRYVHIRRHCSDPRTYLSACYEDGLRFDVTDEDIREGLKWAMDVLHYPETWGS